MNLKSLVLFPYLPAMFIDKMHRPSQAIFGSREAVREEKKPSGVGIKKKSFVDTV